MKFPSLASFPSVKQETKVRRYSYSTNGKLLKINFYLQETISISKWSLTDTYPKPKNFNRLLKEVSYKQKEL